MKILLLARQYFPIIGGMPVVARLISEGLIELGHDVRLLTSVASEKEEDIFEVYRDASFCSLLRLYWWADKVIMIGPSVALGWPTIVFRKPTLISHQAGIPKGFFKRLLMSLCKNVACSNYLAKEIGHGTIGISNPFDSENFCESQTENRRDRDWIYVGRLVAEKGVDVLLRAISELKNEDIYGRCTIVGEGYQEGLLKQLAKDLGIDDRVEFTGSLLGKDLSETVRCHHTGIVPSLWEEPFGIVAVELISCGCVVIGSNVGGLPEAVGSCGVLFERGNSKALSLRMKELLEDKEFYGNFTSMAENHLSRSEPKFVAGKYLEIIS